jgi:hypothetical protein
MSTEHRRVVIAQADGRTGWGIRAPLSVGVVRWRGIDARIAVVLKASLSFASNAHEATAKLIDPEPLQHAQPCELPGAADVLGYPSDYAFPKARCDVLLSGHAHSKEPVDHIEARLAVDDWSRSFMAGHRGQKAIEIPLTAAYLRGAMNERSEPLGPVRDVREGEQARFDGQAPSERQCAAASMQLDTLGPHAVIGMRGLSPRAHERLITLPGCVPRVFVEPRGHQLSEIEACCDTLWIDTDFEKLVLVWRALLPARMRDRDIDRVVVSLEREAARSEAKLMGSLPRGTVAFALEERPVSAGDVDRLEMARYEALEHVAEPELALPAYALIVAQLAEGDREREPVLADNDFDELNWSIEERAWTERMGHAAMAGDGTVAAEFGEHFVEAQDSLAGPLEPRSLEEYAVIKAALDASDVADKALEEHVIKRSEWMRLERHWLARAQSDHKVAKRLDQLIAEAREG